MKYAGGSFFFHNSLNHCKGFSLLPHLAALPRQAYSLLADVSVRAGPDGAGLGHAQPVEALLEAVAADAAGARVAQHVPVVGNQGSAVEKKSAGNRRRKKFTGSGIPGQAGSGRWRALLWDSLPGKPLDFRTKNDLKIFLINIYLPSTRTSPSTGRPCRSGWPCSLPPSSRPFPAPPSPYRRRAAGTCRPPAAAPPRRRQQDRSSCRGDGCPGTAASGKKRKLFRQYELF